MSKYIGQRSKRDTVKFMQVLDRKIYIALRKKAQHTGVTTQEFIRAHVAPYYLENHIPKKKHRR